MGIKSHLLTCNNILYLNSVVFIFFKWLTVRITTEINVCIILIIEDLKIEIKNILLAVSLRDMTKEFFHLYLSVIIKIFERFLFCNFVAYTYTYI